MADNASKIIELETRLPSIESRVKRKREVLQGWLDRGIPLEKMESVPQSLTQARKWEDAELRVFEIGSPNAFTQNHPVVGEDVAAIASLLSKLKSKIKRPAGRSTPAQPKIDAKEIEAAFSAMAAQWHKTREELRVERERAVNAERHLKLTRTELASKENELAELRRRLAGGLSIVK